MKEKVVGYTALHLPSGYWKSFKTDQEAQEYVESECMFCFCGEKPCEARMCEWFTMPSSEFVEEEYGDMMRSSRFVKDE